MFWQERTNRLTGLMLLLLAAFIILNVVFITMAIGDADPTKRGDLEGMLRDINSHQGLYYFATALSIASDGLLVLAVSALLYLTFRDRSRTLALCAFGGLIAAGVAFFVEDAANLTVGVLAVDFVKDGGPGGIPAGDPSILAAARAFSLFGGLADPIGSTAVGLGLAAIGWLLVAAPEGETNPPRWLGVLALIGGLGLTLQWIMFGQEVLGIVIVTVGYISMLVWMVVLAGWLLMRSAPETRPAAARAAAMNA